MKTRSPIFFELLSALEQLLVLVAAISLAATAAIICSLLLGAAASAVLI